VYIEEEL